MTPRTPRHLSSIERLETSNIPDWSEKLKALEFAIFPDGPVEIRGGVARVSMENVLTWLEIPVTTRARNPTVARRIQSQLYFLGWRNESRRRLLSTTYFKLEPSTPYRPSIDMRKRMGDRSMHINWD